MVIHAVIQLSYCMLDNAELHNPPAMIHREIIWNYIFTLECSKFLLTKWVYMSNTQKTLFAVIWPPYKLPLISTNIQILGWEIVTQHPNFLFASFT